MSAAEAVTWTFPDTVAPFTGVVMPTVGRVVSGRVCVVASGTFETRAQFGTSSRVRIANQYRVDGVRPPRFTVSLVPASPGIGVAMLVPEAKFASVSGPELE